jgi:Fis family transcriptional regulator, factor for inversion stimulation protein
MTAANRFTLHAETEDQMAISKPRGSLREQVEISLEHYFSQLDGQPASDLYQMVLEQVEAPLLDAVMAYTQGNQSKAATMLGLNRGTLRKKLKQYDLL